MLSEKPNHCNALQHIQITPLPNLTPLPNSNLTLRCIQNSGKLNLHMSARTCTCGAAWHHKIHCKCKYIQGIVWRGNRGATLFTCEVLSCTSMHGKACTVARIGVQMTGAYPQILCMTLHVHTLFFTRCWRERTVDQGTQQGLHQ